jgi:hypothetical protein
MALLTNQVTARTGLNLSPVAASGGGDTIDNTDENVILYVNNGGGAPITVTIATPGTVDGLAITDRTVSVTNGQSRYIGPFKNKVYGQAVGGLTSPVGLAITYSGVSSVTVAAIKLGNL